MCMPHIGCNPHTWHMTLMHTKCEHTKMIALIENFQWNTICGCHVAFYAWRWARRLFNSSQWLMVSIPLVFSVQRCHQSVVKRWNESRLHSIRCTAAKGSLVIPCFVFIALFFNSKLWTHSNSLRFIIEANRIHSFEKCTMRNNCDRYIQIWRWKRHIDAFLSFCFVAIFAVVVCSSSARPWHPFENNEHTWTISLNRC